MTQDEIIEMARQAGLDWHKGWTLEDDEPNRFETFAKLVAAKEREALEVELLKLKQGVAANSDYIQGRWDLIGEFQDIIRAKG
jgi:hypothetical protein